MSFKMKTPLGSRKGHTGVWLWCEAEPCSCGCFTWHISGLLDFFFFSLDRSGSEAPALLGV